MSATPPHRYTSFHPFQSNAERKAEAAKWHAEQLAQEHQSGHARDHQDKGPAVAALTRVLSNDGLERAKRQNQQAVERSVGRVELSHRQQVHYRQRFAGRAF
ncbi:hypothetical protein BMF94_4722 [Rhodotorula taiwanensis]|uniref:Uncharacterized protein n=1 Tax=Rhodotorula taiwanensis TaxID=741276 RepID=A0A2S5B638_9BASI|nr:hypothetical protein BMF94_4722 [Rhodotorula taiwanensis]